MTSPNSSSAEDSLQPASLVEEFSHAKYREWYQEREAAQNIQQGQAYFNGPNSPPAAERHSPSQLLQCHRKIAYRQNNAPAEEEPSRGIFWFGTRFEEEVALPFLREAVTGADTYACNSIWVDFTVDIDTNELRIKGETDPVIVNRDGEPILATEIKTKKSVDDIDAPNRHHKAQIHAYMRGLSKKYERSIADAIIVYGSRTTLDIASFHIEFDPEFWTETVLEWADSHTAYRLDQDLPPADPEFDWECRFCDYRQRCGQSESPHSDECSIGLLPLTESYPRARLQEYLRAYPDARLTPTLAREYPDLTTEYGVYDWRCQVCQSEYPVDDIEWDARSSRPPSCPSCAKDGIHAKLAGPPPHVQAGRIRGPQAREEDQS